MTPDPSPPKFSPALPFLLGYMTIFALVGSLGLWSVLAQIEGAVIAQGIVKVENDKQIVQHAEGGVVGEILAKNGDVVTAGQSLLRLDSTFLDSELALIERQLLEMDIRGARLKAEINGTDFIYEIADRSYSRIDEEWISEQVSGQKALLAARRVSQNNEINLRREQILQLERQIESAEVQLGANAEQIASIEGELSVLGGLLENGLVQEDRILSLQREVARLKGELGRLMAVVAESRGQRAAIELELLRLTDLRREKALEQSEELEFSKIELEERVIQLLEQRSRLDIRAPASGVVFGSALFTVPSVIRAGDVLMSIVPNDRPVMIAANIDAIDIDQVHVGQSVNLVFPTFEQRLAAEFEGTLVQLSADAVADERTGAQFYEAIIVPNPESLERVAGVEIIPGLPVQAFVRTERRTPLNYLTRPLAIYFNQAFRES